MCSLDKKTLLIGLDAACWDYLDPLLQADRLPALRKIIDAGNGGILKSTLPAMTPTAWSTLITGKNPGKHGVFEMMWRKPGGYDFVPTSAGSRQGTPFWKYLNDAGIRVGLVNIPFTHPPTPVDGFMLCGFGAPETARDLTWPPEALEWVDNGAEPYRPAVSTELLRSGRPEKILEAEVRHQAHVIEIGLALAEKRPVDVLAINFMLTDHANHKMPRADLLDEAGRRRAGLRRRPVCGAFLRRVPAAGGCQSFPPGHRQLRRPVRTHPSIPRTRNRDDRWCRGGAALPPGSVLDSEA
jgi:predicted AlkP superfamily phosphohydrolase/phosphomutase